MDRIYYMLIPETSHDFEILMQLVCSKKYGTSFSLYGRNGQNQNGIDLYADNFEICVQCKNYQGPDAHKRLAKELQKDFRSACDAFGKEMKHYIIATTAPRDTKIQKLVTQIAEQTDIVIDCMFWEDIRGCVSPQVLRNYHQATGHDICEQYSEGSYELTISEVSETDRMMLLICNKKAIKKIAAITIGVFFVIILSITQLSNFYKDSETIQTANDSITNNYMTGNYEQVEQEIYKVYPILERRRKLDLLISYTDMLLESVYDRWYMSGMPLTENESVLVNYYINKGKEYSDKKQDMPSYLEFCVHQAKFAFSEYTCTLNTLYLDEMYKALCDAGTHFEWEKYAEISVQDYEDVRWVNEVFNLKNLGTLYLINVAEGYRTCSAMVPADSYEDYEASFENFEITINDLLFESAKFVTMVCVVEDQCDETNLITPEILQHWRTVATLAYIDYGNLVAPFDSIPPLYTSGSDYFFGGCLDYENLELCYQLFAEMERDAIAQHNYYDLENIYASAESYFFSYYLYRADEQALTYYDEFLGKWLKYDPSGFSIPPHLALTDNVDVMNKILTLIEDEYTDAMLLENPFLYGLSHYRIGSCYLAYADACVATNAYDDALAKYETALQFLNSALLYFSEKHEYIYASIISEIEYISEQISIYR